MPYWLPGEPYYSPVDLMNRRAVAFRALGVIQRQVFKFANGLLGI
jgi:hypothetical protein